MVKASVMLVKKMSDKLEKLISGLEQNRNPDKLLRNYSIGDDMMQYMRIAGGERYVNFMLSQVFYMNSRGENLSPEKHDYLPLAFCSSGELAILRNVCK